MAMAAQAQELRLGRQRDLVPDKGVRADSRLSQLDDQSCNAAGLARQEQLDAHFIPGGNILAIRQQKGPRPGLDGNDATLD